MSNNMSKIAVETPKTSFIQLSPDYLEVSDAIILYTFEAELPDPDQELSVQLPTKFQLFKNLPAEIRCLIWRLCLPKGRRVFLRFPSSTALKLLRSPPITTKINKESRVEALKSYRLLQHSFSPKSGFRLPERYTFWDENNDTLKVDIRNILASATDEEKLNSIFFAFWDSKTRALKHVRNLEIKDSDLYLSTYFDLADRIKTNCSSFIRKFQGLKEIGLLINLPEDGVPVTAETDMGKDRIRWLTGIFEKEKNTDSGIYIPKIYLSKLPGR